MRELIEKLMSGETPTFALGGAGLILLLITFKMAKGFVRPVLILAAIALLGGSVWWHFHKH